MGSGGALAGDRSWPPVAQALLQSASASADGSAIGWRIATMAINAMPHPMVVYHNDDALHADARYPEARAN